MKIRITEVSSSPNPADAGEGVLFSVQVIEESTTHRYSYRYGFIYDVERPENSYPHRYSLRYAARQ